MPSRDAEGRRLSGAAQRRRIERIAAGLAPDPSPEVPQALARVGPPPCADGIEPCLEWANDVALAATAAALDADAEPARVRLVVELCGGIGQLRDKALQSETAIKVRRDREGTDTDLTTDAAPLGDALATPAWCFLRLCRAAHEAATTPELSDYRRKQLQLLGSALCVAGYLREKHQTQALVDRADGAGEAQRRPPMLMVLPPLVRRLARAR
jgi:hypothetical protein